MKCPFCGSDDTQVKDSRPAQENSGCQLRNELDAFASLVHEEQRRVQPARCPECDGRHAYPCKGALEWQCMDCDTVYIAKDS